MFSGRALDGAVVPLSAGTRLHKSDVPVSVADTVTCDFAPDTRGHGETALWGGVVLQAMDDIASLPLASLDYAAAVAFFTAGGWWQEGRTDIADCIGVHPDILERAGRRAIAARRAAEGLPPETAGAWSPPSRGQSLRRPITRALIGPPAKRSLPVERRRRPAEGRAWNPFDPHRYL